MTKRRMIGQKGGCRGASVDMRRIGEIPGRLPSGKQPCGPTNFSEWCEVTGLAIMVGVVLSVATVACLIFLR